MNHTRAQIKEVAREVLYNSLAQAVVKIFKTRHVLLKVYLFLFVITVSSLASYMVISSIATYFSYEVTTMLRTVKEASSPFPQITFCNWNQFTSADSIPLLRSINMKVNASIDIFDQEQMRMLDSETKHALITEIYNLAIAHVTDKTFSDIERKKLAHRLDNMLMSCSFNKEACTADDFSWLFDASNGNCYIFNSGVDSAGKTIHLKESTMSGSQNGLFMELYVNFHENLTYFNSYTGDGLGISIYIDNSSSSLENRDFSDIVIAPGYQTKVAIYRSFVNMLPRPYSNCELELAEINKHLSVKLVNLIHNSSYKYTQQLCYEQCYQMNLISECNCTDNDLLSLFSTDEDICSEFELQCKVNVYKRVYNNFIDSCSTYCPLECNVNRLYTQISFSKFIGQKGVDLINENSELRADFVTKPLDVYNAKESIVQVYLYYDTLSYQISTESPQMNFVSLLASIGGNLGLFLGVSVFSVCELVEILIEVLYILKARRVSRII